MQKLGRDPYHKLNHHRKAGPMRDRERTMDEKDMIEEQMPEPVTQRELEDEVDRLRAVVTEAERVICEGAEKIAALRKLNLRLERQLDDANEELAELELEAGYDYE